MTYEEIVAKARETVAEKDASGYKGHLAVEVNVTGEGAGVFYIEVKDGKMKVEPYNYNDHDCRLTASADLLLKIVSGKADAVAAFMTGKLKVDRSVEKALEFQKILKGK